MQQIPVEEIVKIQNKWILTLPSSLRKGLFEENGYVRVTKDKGRLILEPVRMLSYPVRSYTDEELEEFIKFDAEESKSM